MEFSLCLRRALRSPEKSHLHFIEARHRLLLKTVLRSRRNFSVLCVGSPDQAVLSKRADIYRRAFATGRLKFIVETEAVRRDWEQLAGEHVVHIPAALIERTEKQLEKKEARRLLGLPDDTFICLFFGTHREGKDYQTAIEAAKRSEAKPYLFFVGPLISGNNPDVLLKELSYENATSLNQYYPDKKVSLLFDACDVVVLPYVEGYVKGSGVLLQACKYSKPVIASDTGHLAEFVNTHQTGLLYKPEGASSLAVAYDTLAFAKSDFINNLSLSISETKKSYLWSTLVDRYLKIFKVQSLN